MAGYELHLPNSLQLVNHATVPLHILEITACIMIDISIAIICSPNIVLECRSKYFVVEVKLDKHVIQGNGGEVNLFYSCYDNNGSPKKNIYAFRPQTRINQYRY
jgi:hypothetical protein